MSSARVVLHADMDAFYASVEQRERPELRGRPLVVGGTGDRGVVSAASYEARAFGIRSAMPTALARRLCSHAVFLRGDMRRYADESRRLFAIFRDFTPSVEGISIDEAFLDLSGTARLLGPARQVGERLRARVRAERGLPVSVGIAPVKMVAKIASAAAKPDGLREVPPEGVRAFLAPLPVRVVWGVGPVTAERLRRAGFETVGEVADADPRRLAAVLGDWAHHFARLARGEDLREVEPYREAVSYSEENTFERDVWERDRLEAAIRVHAESVARRLRRDGLRGRTVVLKLRLGRRRAPGPRGYPLLTRRATLEEASDDGDVFARAARDLLVRADPAEPVRLLGVGVTNLVTAAEAQLPLFGEPEGRAQRRRLNRALDEIAERFGTGAVQRGAEGPAERAGLSDRIKRGETPEPRR
jgi:DNA polymerase-4